MKKDENKKESILYTFSFFLITTHTNTSPFYLSLKKTKILKEEARKKEERKGSCNVHNERVRLI